jgi:exonuclease III
MRVVSWCCPIACIAEAKRVSVFNSSTVSDLLEVMSVDVLCVQKTNMLDMDVATSRLANMPYVWHSTASHRNENSGVSVFSRWPGVLLFEIKSRLLIVKIGPVIVVNALAPKSITYGDKNLGSSNLLVRNEWFATATAGVIASLSSCPTARYVVCGNFSTVYHYMDMNREVQRNAVGSRKCEVRGLLKFMSDLRLTDPFREANPEMIVFTYRSHLSKSLLGGWRHDYIFCGQSMRGDTDVRHLKWEGSNHRPVMMTIRGVVFV